jgi:FKBP-type peptidyl-prolyl cis-trans isomerase
VGSKVEITCPSALAYGKDGLDGIVPPNEDLEFVMEVVNVLPPRKSYAK